MTYSVNWSQHDFGVKQCQAQSLVGWVTAEQILLTHWLRNFYVPFFVKNENEIAGIVKT